MLLSKPSWRSDFVKTFLRVLWLMVSSILLATLPLIVLFAFAALGGAVEESLTASYIWIFIVGVLHIRGSRRLAKKDGLKKVLISNVIIFSFLVPASYFYFKKDHTEIKNPNLNSKRNFTSKKFYLKRTDSISNVEKSTSVDSKK